MMTGDSILESLGVDPLINAIGYATPLGNGRQEEDVIAAVAEASRFFISIAHLQEEVGRRIAELTHAEAAYVTPGAAAGLTLATAACIAGLDPTRMNLLPETADDTPSTVVVHRSHRYDYDHAVRQAGANLRDVGFPNLTFPYELDAALDEDVAAVLFRADGPRNVVPFDEVIRLAHAKGIPVIVDAALAVPPVDNLWRFTEEGADLAVFSGGKAIGGPPASGFIAGRRDLIASVALQHQDMDVRLETWDPPSLDAESTTFPPYQGIGRPMKVGKEQIVGLIVALESYVQRDHRADVQEWMQRAEVIRDSLAERLVDVDMTIEHGQQVHVPQLKINLESKARAAAVSKALHDRRPSVYCHEGGLWDGYLLVVPSTVRPGEVANIVDALVDEIRNSTESDC